MGKKQNFQRGNFLFLFVVAFLMGMIAKRTISTYVRIGYQDPSTVIAQGESYDFNRVQQDLAQKAVMESEMQAEEPLQ